MFSNGIYFSDIWFSVVKIYEEAIAEGVDYCGQVKTSHKGFCLDTLEKLTKEWPGGFDLVMKGNPRVPCDIPISTIGYK